LPWLRGQVGLVLQDAVLFTGTVAENIAYGLRASSDEIEAAAKAAGAHAFIGELPEAYDTELGPRGVGLSGGQRQRIAIARMLLRDPALVVLDEPTTGLDPESQELVLAGLDVLMRGRTTILITHSRALAMAADRVVVVADGVVTRDGAPAEVLAEERAHRRSRVGRVRMPVDPALPHLPVLLDPASMAPVLRRSLGRDVPDPEARIRYLRYKPGTSLLVHYDVEVDSEWHEAFAMISSRTDLARRASKPEYLALARRVDGRSPALLPLAYDAEVDSMIQWFPLDVWLPALAEPPGDLVSLAGSDRAAGTGEQFRLLRYKPRRRAVLGFDDLVVKIYADQAAFQRAATALQTAAGLRTIRAPAFVQAVPDRRLTIQRRLPGGPPGEPVDAALNAGELVARLHATGIGRGFMAGMPEIGSRRRLEAASASARLAAALAPRLQPRLERLSARLAADAPPDELLVLSHGDFHAKQLLETGDGLAVIDFDAMCEAAPAYDLASYAAHLVRGDPEDLATAAGALDALMEGYGERPPAIAWYLACAILGRAPFPFRYLDDRWPERMEGMIETAEAALAL
jgi:energy-coupling factor transporter ATP-binding protein EcfA2